MSVYNNIVNNQPNANSQLFLTSWYTSIQSTSAILVVILPYINVSDQQMLYIQFTPNSTGNISIIGNFNKTVLVQGSTNFTPNIGYGYYFQYTQSTNAWWILSEFTDNQIGI